MTPRDAPREEQARVTRLPRRTLLRRLGLAGAGTLVLAACGGGEDPEPADTAGQDDTSTPVDQEDAASAALDTVGVDAPLTLSPIVATFELLTGTDRRLQFGLADAERNVLLDADLDAWLVHADSGEVVAGPVEPLFYDEGLGQRGVYAIEADVPAPGLHDFVVALADRSGAGTAAVRVIRPEDSQVIRPGQAFPAVATPTTEDEMGLAELCTREPDCGMHDISVDEALEAGQPLVLTIATPKYCQTAVCGPVVDVVLERKESGDHEGVQFIHVEVFEDAGNTPTGIITELGLPSEPWTFLIGADGTLVDRFDGPLIPSLLDDAISEL